MVGEASSRCTFYDKKLENVYVCSEHFTEDCYEVSYRYEMLGGETRNRRLKQDAVPKIFQRKLLLSHAFRRAFAVIQEIPSCHRQEVK